MRKIQGAVIPLYLRAVEEIIEYRPLNHLVGNRQQFCTIDENTIDAAGPQSI